MKANIAFMYGPKDLRIENVEVPELKPNQILIKTKACGIWASPLRAVTTLHRTRRVTR